MKTKTISKLLYYLSLIPFVGLLIAIFGSWIYIYKTTNEKKYIVIHYFIWLLPSIIVFGILSMCFVFFLADLQETLRAILTLFSSYFALIIISVLSVSIAKGIIEKYNRDSIK